MTLGLREFYSLTSIHRVRRTGVLMILVLMGIGPDSVVGQAGTADLLQQRQRDQERARAMASELATSVLDIQLRQWAENNLQSLPIYGEIMSMRTNIHRLVERDMPEVVELLVQAQHAVEDARQQAPQSAQPDAQQRVSELAQQARSQLGDEAPPAANSLADARSQSHQAIQALADGSQPAIRDAQGKSAAALDRTVEALRQAIQDESAQQASRAQEGLEQAAKLTEQSVPVDAGAAAALTQATAAAQNPNETELRTPSPEAVDAAQGLADAADKFAEAQRATGEGAAEISQQREVANQPIRQAPPCPAESDPVPFAPPAAPRLRRTAETIL